MNPIPALSLFLALLCSQSSFATPPRPNIIVFIADDHGQLDSTPYGATDVRTPNMQRLADDGMTFTHAFVASPSCAPSRTAMLTGLMPARNGAERNHTFKRDDVASLPEAMRRLGYQTAAFGKVAHGKKDTARHGFDVADERNDAAFISRFLDARDASKPLCVFVGSHDPHVPWPAIDGYNPAQVNLPPTFIDTPETREFRARYYTAVTRADTLLGEVRDLAKRHFDPAQTLIVYTSDHGGQWPFGKWNLYDSGIRVPLLAAWPGVIAPGSRAEAMVQWIDLLPTLIDAGGGAAPEGLDGRSFFPVLRGEAATHREAIFTTHSGDALNVYPIRAVRTADRKFIANLHPEFVHTTFIDKALAQDGGRYWISWFEKAKRDPAAAATVNRYHRRPAVELYDLRADPFEQHNLAADPAHARRVKEMSDQLAGWMREQDDKQTVFNAPYLFTDPASTRPGNSADADSWPGKEKPNPKPGR